MLARIQPTDGLRGSRRLRPRDRGCVREPRHQGGRHPQAEAVIPTRRRSSPATPRRCRSPDWRRRRSARTQFIGIHFFSPVDKMPLVEVIVGRKTCEETLARALDYVEQIRKTPIVVNDSRGFYTSRVFGTFATKAWRCCEEGVVPALIENAARHGGHAGGPAGGHGRSLARAELEDHAADAQDLGRRFQTPVTYETCAQIRRGAEATGRSARRRLLRVSEGRRESTCGRASPTLFPARRAAAGGGSEKRAPLHPGARDRALPRGRRGHAPPPRRTSARFSAGASRPGPAARCRSSTRWG